MVTNATAQPLVTVAFPTRNRCHELEQTLNSILMQDYPNIEILVVDDASEDNTLDVLRQIKQVEVRVNPRPIGAWPSRNILMRQSKGKYFIGIDDDSSFTRPDDVTEIVRIMEANPYIGLLDLVHISQLDAPHIGVRRKEIRECPTFHGCSHVIRRSLIDTLPLYREWMPFGNGESDLAMQVYAAGSGVYHYEGVVIHHRIDKMRRRETATGRCCDKGEYSEIWRKRLQAKNSIVASLLHAPCPECVALSVYRVLSYLWLYGKTGALRYRATLVGATLLSQLGLLRESGIIRRDRLPMKRKDFYRWVKSREGKTVACMSA